MPQTANCFSKIIFSFLFFLLPEFFSAQTTPGLKHYGVNDGLSEGTVISLVQDQQGFIWVGTENGLNRFDGYSFRQYQNDPHDTTSLSSNFVYALVLDSSGKVWIGAGNKINVYDPVTDRLSRFSKWNPPGKISKAPVRNLVFLNNGLLLVMTAKGFATIDTASGKYTGYLGMKENAADSLAKPISCYFRDEQNNFWFGTDDGELLKWFAATPSEKFGTATITCEAIVTCNAAEAEGTGINAIAELHQHDLILATDCGVRFFDEQTNSFINYFKQNSFSDTLCHCDFANIMKKDEDHFFLLGQGRLTILDFSQRQIQTLLDNRNDESVFTTGREFISDKQGMIWIGDFGMGLFSYNPSATKFGMITADESIPNHLKNPYVFNFCESGDSVLVGSNWGFDILFPKTGIVKSILPYPDRPAGHFPLKVMGTIIGDSSDIWFVTRYSMSGLMHWNIVTGEKRFYDNENGLSSQKPRGLIQMPDGKFWIPTVDKGVVIFNPRTGKSTTMQNDSANANSISSNYVNDILLDSKGKIWISTNKGLNCYDTTSKKIEHFRLDIKDSSSISTDDVFGVTEDRAGTIWVATSFGFGKLDRATGKLKNYTTKKGLADNFVNAILADSLGYLWISTNKGICSFDPVKETFNIYGLEDGLQDEEFNVGAAYYGKSGYMYFGGVNGMNYFDPKHITGNKYAPPVFITSLIINENPFPIDSNIILKKNIDLDYTQNFLSIDFVALNYFQSSKNRFACMMEGVDKDWVQLGKTRTASYPNLPPGDYVFHVKACNNDGIWNETGTTLRITIHPPFWKTKWFYALCILIVIGAFWFYVNLREKNLKRDRKILEQKVNERTNELHVEKEKLAEANKDIKDSINYASRIQSAILPPEKMWHSLFSESFVLYKPKDIVAGDFYFLENVGDKIIVAAADCTGHGVPGAMVSVVCSNALSRAVKEFELSDPGKILDKVTQLVLETFEKSESAVNDGMDISLLVIDKKTNAISWAGANNPLWYIVRGEMKEIKADKQPIGKFENLKPFTTHKLNAESGSVFYLFTDGYADQFGGPQGKKFKYKQLGETLLSVSEKKMSEQKIMLEQTFENWKGNIEQVDDVLLIGIRV
jgi:ligand-binding sensor domain-containing protein/serine phosphatase RsbU (regulator of sigma subunit)